MNYLFLKFFQMPWTGTTEPRRARDTSVRSKNIFTDISRYPTGKHEIMKNIFTDISRYPTGKHEKMKNIFTDISRYHTGKHEIMCLLTYWSWDIL